MLCAKFGCNLFSGSGEHENVNSLRQRRHRQRHDDNEDGDGQRRAKNALYVLRSNQEVSIGNR